MKRKERSVELRAIVLRPGNWHDRGRSLLTLEKIAEQAALGRELFDAAMRGRLADVAPTLTPNHR